MSESTGDDAIDQVVAAAHDIPGRPLPEQPDAYNDVYEELAAQLQQSDAGRPSGQ